VSDLVLVASQGSAEPVEDVFEDVLRRIKLNQVSDDLEAGNSLASVLVDELDLLLDLGVLDRCLQQGEHAGHARLGSGLARLLLRPLTFLGFLLLFLRLGGALDFLIEELQWDLELDKELRLLLDLGKDHF
jgi:hypothetical protein